MPLRRQPRLVQVHLQLRTIAACCTSSLAVICSCQLTVDAGPPPASWVLAGALSRPATPQVPRQAHRPPADGGIPARWAGHGLLCLQAAHSRFAL